MGILMIKRRRISKIVDEYLKKGWTIEKLAQVMENCNPSVEPFDKYLERVRTPRLPDDVWGVICEMEENPYEVIKRIDAGICPKHTPLHFVGNYKVDTKEKLDGIEEVITEGYNIRSLEISSTSDEELFKITSLPELPKGLQNLSLSRLYRLTSLPELPEGLQSLKIGWVGGRRPWIGMVDDLTSLPKLPDKLKILELRKIVNLTTLPELPNELRSLNLVDLPNLTSLPELPTNLQNLKLWKLRTSLSRLPKKLQSLELTEMSAINTLPELPEAMYNLKLWKLHNLLRIPRFPKKLQNLDLNSLPMIRDLPVLPMELKTLELKRLNRLNLIRILRGFNIRMIKDLKYRSKIDYDN